MAQVRLFAAAADAASASQLTRTEPTLAALREALSSEFEALRSILPRCAVLVDGVRRDDDAPLGSDTLVDVLPPFAGG